MEIAIIVLAGLAVYHFVYEGILAPSFRLKLRFELFELRDELRKLKISHAEDLRDEHFDDLQASINTQIAFLYRFDFATLALAEAASRHDPDFKKRAEERSRMLDECHIQRAQIVRKKSLKIAARALIVNSGACALYLIPIFIVVSGYSALKKRVRLFASLSDNDFKRVSIDDDKNALCPS